MLVEAAFAASRTPGPLRAFYRRVKERRGFQIATVAVARKLAVLCWHLVTKDEDYAFARPSLTPRGCADVVGRHADDHQRQMVESAGGTSADGEAVSNG